MRVAVPNNDMDIPAGFWSRHMEPPDAKTPQRLKTMKPVRPTWLRDGKTIHYLWELPDPLPDEIRGHVETLSAAARSVVALGWGVDLVAGSGRILSAEDAARLSGERWRPTSDSAADGLRVPTPGTLDALVGRHQAFLHRLDGDGLTPVPALAAFAVVGYRRDTDTNVVSRPFAAFALLTPDAEGFRTFDPVRQTHTVAAMLRNAAGQAAELHRPDDRRWRVTFVMGHGDGSNRQATSDQRFAYLPIPTIEERKANGRRNFVVGSIRRVLVVEPAGGSGSEVAWVRQRLSGQLLTDEATRRPKATLALIPGSDRRLRWYVGPARAWSTVTPVILPGFDDRDEKKAERLLRSALGQSGYPAVLVEAAALEWRPVGFRPGLDVSRRYGVGSHHQYLPRYHVRITWPVAVRGPVCLGTGRYYGLGLFATEEPPSGE